MLQPLKEILKTKKIVLASQSPRRKELMKYLGLDVLLRPSTFEENLKPSDFAAFSQFVEETAYQKVLEVATRIADEKPDMIIGADTIVELNGVVYGKPKTPQKAFEVLMELANKQHNVYTGVVIKYGERVVKFTETTRVFFGEISPEAVQAYVDTGDPLDKAGSYGIQGVGGTLIERIEGDFYTVMGLPLYRISKEISKLILDADK